MTRTISVNLITPQGQSNAVKCFPIIFPQGEKSRELAPHINQSHTKMICLQAAMINWVASQARRERKERLFCGAVKLREHHG